MSSWCSSCAWGWCGAGPGGPPDGTACHPRSGGGHGIVRSWSSSGERRDGLARLDHRVDQAVLDGLLGGPDLGTLDVVADLLDRAAAVVADHLLEQLAHPQDL